MSWPAYTASAGESSGAVVTPANATTGSIAAGGASENLDVDLGFNEGWFSAVVTRTAGASTSVGVLWYADAARTILHGAICGSTFAFIDADATGKLHLVVYNHDFGGEPGTFNVAIKAIET